MCTNDTQSMDHSQRHNPSTMSTEHVMDLVEQSWGRFVNLVSRLSRLLHLREKWEQAKIYAQEHPFVTLFTLVMLGMCSVPIMCFMAFAFGTLFLTFMGFLFVEGFLLTLGSVLLGGILFVVGFLSVGLSSCLALAYYAISSSQRMLRGVTTGWQGVSKHYRLPFNLLRFENANGACVKDYEEEETEEKEE